MDVPHGTGVTSETPPVQAALLRRAWFDVAATVAPQLADLPALLDTHLTELEHSGRLDEPSLLGVAEDASQYALEHGAGDVARALSKRLRRAIYEFLLALDAVNPAELDPAAVQPFAAPPAAPAPRTPVALTPGDVSGADDAPSAGGAPAVEAAAEAPPVPLWEQVSAPPTTREVYHVASREVTPLTDAAPTANMTDGLAAPEVGASDAAPSAGEAFHDTEAAIAEVFDGDAQDVEALASTSEPSADVEAVVAVPEAETDAAPGAEATVAEPEAVADEAVAEAEPAVFEPEVVAEHEAGAETEPTVEALSEGVAEAEVTAEAAPATDSSAEPVAEGPEAPEASTTEFATDAGAQPEATADPVAELAEPDILTWQPAQSPESTWSPVVDVPPAPAAETGPEPNGAPNGVRPPRDLLRVPRQFRRLPPLPGRRAPHPEDEIVLPAEPDASAWSSAVPQPADVAPEAPPAPPAGEPVADEDDVLGVPALPWPADAAEQPAEPVAETPVESEEEVGLPFHPFAVAEEPAAAPVPEPEPAQPAAITDSFYLDETAAEAFAAAAAAEASSQEPSATAPIADDEDLPTPPPIFEEPLHQPGAAAQPLEYPELPPVAPAAGGQAAWPPVPGAAPGASPFPIAPVEGFHLTDPGALDIALGNTPEAPASPVENPFTAAIPPVNVPPSVHIAPPAPAPLPPLPSVPAAAVPAPATPAPAAPTPAAPAAPATPGAADATDEGAWRVRQSPRAQLLAERMAQKRREEAARAAFEAASVKEDHKGRKRRKGEDALPDLPSASRQLAENLRKKRGAEAAALLQRLAQELGGREVADLALDAGDRCRALGQSRSATNCYLAAWRADPLYETPLWRLSDICLNEQDIDLAVGYLERIADLMRSRGDDEGAIGVYRKIAMIAPERQDVRDVIRLAKTTGRLDV